MSEWTPTDRRIGMWAAAGLPVIAGLYIACGLIGVTVRPASPDLLKQVDPFLAILEALMSLAAVDLVVVMGALYAYAERDRKTFALAALALMIIFTTLTCSLHFASLTVGRRLDPGSWAALSRQLSFDEWPSVAMSLDLLAWDFFLGLSLLFAARIFKGQGLSARVRTTMSAAGTLCLTATLAPASGQLGIQYLGIAGYALVLPLACIWLALLFQRDPAVVSGASPIGTSR